MNDILFAAQWTQHNAYLQTSLSTIIQSPFHTSFEKIQHCFNRGLTQAFGTLLFPLKSFTRSMVLPSSQISQEAYHQIAVGWQQRWENPFPIGRQAQLIQTYEPIILEMITPDGTLIKGVWYKHRSSTDANLPTILCFNHNRVHAKSTEWEWLLKKGLSSPQPFHVIVFDYRRNPSQADDLLVDGETVIQTALTKLGIAPANLHLFGYSIGGAVSAILANLHPDLGRIVNRSSFSSLEKLLQHSPEAHETLGDSLFFFVPKPLLPLILNRRTKWITAMISTGLGWNLDPSYALKKIKNRLLVVYHPQDRLIPPALGAIAVNGMTSSTLAMRFKPTVNSQASSFDYHLAPLHLFEDSQKQNATYRILNFILGRTLFSPKPSHPRKHYLITPQGKITQGLRMHVGQIF